GLGIGLVVGLGGGDAGRRHRRPAGRITGDRGLILRPARPPGRRGAPLLVLGDRFEEGQLVDRRLLLEAWLAFDLGLLLLGFGLRFGRRPHPRGRLFRRGGGGAVD